MTDAQPYYAYVATNGLDSINLAKQAVDLLKRANQRWPLQTDLLYSLALYSNKIKDKMSLQIALDELQVLMPNNPKVQQWLLQND